MVLSIGPIGTGCRRLGDQQEGVDEHEGKQEQDEGRSDCKRRFRVRVHALSLPRVAIS